MELYWGMAEPEQLLRGRRFREIVQKNFKDHSEGRVKREEHIKFNGKKRGRMDILIDDIGDEAVILEIKATDWDKIKEHAGYTRVFASENDPYVKLRKGKELAYGLGTHRTVIVGAGHFNKDAGYIEFPILLKELEDLAKGKKVEGIKPEEDEDETKDKKEDSKPGQ